MRPGISVVYFFVRLGRLDGGLAAFFRALKKSLRFGSGMAIAPSRTVGLLGFGIRCFIIVILFYERFQRIVAGQLRLCGFDPISMIFNYL